MSVSTTADHNTVHSYDSMGNPVTTNRQHPATFHDFQDDDEEEEDSMIAMAKDSMMRIHSTQLQPQLEEAKRPPHLLEWAQKVNKPIRPLKLPEPKIMHPQHRPETTFQKGFISSKQDGLYKWKCGDCQLTFVASKSALVVQCPKCQAIL